MRHVVQSPVTPFLINSATGSPHRPIWVHQIPSQNDNLVWLLVDQNTQQGAVIDGPEAATTLAKCTELGVTLKYLLNTHTHHDHIGINKDLQTRGLLNPLEVYGSKITASDIPGITIQLVEGDVFHLFDIPIKVMLTEGHIDGHISFLIGDVLFCGDVMFGAGCGYVFQGPHSKLYNSLKRIASLPQNTKICCAHEYTEDNLRFAWMVEPDNPHLQTRIQQTWALRARGECTIPTTIEAEKKTNPFIRLDSPSIIKSLNRLCPNVSLASEVEIFTALRQLKDQGKHKSTPDSELPL